MTVMARALAMFDDFVDLPTTERQQALAALRDQDPALHRELARLLVYADTSSGILDRGFVATPPQTPDALRARATQAGDCIGGFTLRSLLGRGGMGEVWLAERSHDGFRQRVALKLLHIGLTHPDLKRRFQQECRILAQLSHPRIAAFIDGGISADGRPWYAMAFVEGEPLNDYVARVQPDVRARVRLLLEASEALSHAQAQLIVHRDLKPSNILVDATGHAHLLDFGIAKLLDAEDPDEHETATGLRALSPAYAAPEQVFGQRIGTATDVYALGLVLFELLSGQLPHQRRGARLEVLADLVRSEQFPAPSALLRKQPGQLTATINGAIDHDLDIIALKATQSEPERRYPNAQSFTEDLQRWLDGRPIRAQADTATYRLRKFVGRHRLAVGSAMVTVLGLIVGLALALWQADAARQARAHAEASKQQAEQALTVTTEAEARTQRVKQFMMDTFIMNDPMQAPGDRPASLADAFDQAMVRIDSLTDDPKLQVDLWDDFGEIRAGQGRFADAAVLFDKSLAQARRIYPANHPVIAEGLVNRGVVESYAGNSRAAAPYIEEAVAILDVPGAKQDQDLSNALQALAGVREAEGRRADSLAIMGRVVALTKRMQPVNELDLGVALFNYATALHNASRIDEAEPIANEAITVTRRAMGDQAPNLILMLSLKALIDYRRGRLDDAVRTNEEKLAIARKNFPAAHPWTADALVDVGFDRVEAGDTTRGIADLDAAIAMYDELGSPLVLHPLRMRALATLWEFGPKAARPFLDRGAAICTEQAITHLQCDIIRANRAGVMAMLGDGEAALVEADLALAGLAERGASEQAEQAQGLEGRARALTALGRHAEAVATQQQALTVISKWYPEGHPERKRVQKNLERIKQAREAK
ncbi:hypothetical protein C7S18_14965 [Ahniella affigens]|uniref:Protein kinase domain-containing protein n=1 Tax=Ahniella affigens TaxID=2021234 RepID=A0A2P1PU92_9GAMM|nr:serine/threonine-protein kinase [Ahniella affigens]AVP98408.1 hypothetical protein C7S18_14965 [Ahniella affigens]